MASQHELVRKGLVLIFSGPPGSGKGTYGKILAERWGIRHVSIGDLIRAKLAACTCLKSGGGSKDGCPLQDNEAFQLNKIRVEQGLLIQDAVATELCKQHISSCAQQTSWILDGFPRTMQQAEALRSFARPHACINFHLPAAILLKKLLGRRLCTTCGGNFNVADIYNPPFILPAILPKAECVHCGGKARLAKRNDDTEETIQKRLDAHKQLTAPMLNYYETEGVLLNFEVVRGIQDIPRLEEAIISFLRRKHHEMRWYGIQ